jgi:hypothetical protein
MRKTDDAKEQWHDRVVQQPVFSTRVIVHSSAVWVRQAVLARNVWNRSDVANRAAVHRNGLMREKSNCVAPLGA